MRWGNQSDGGCVGVSSVKVPTGKNTLYDSFFIINILFYPQSAFYPWSAVYHQSAFYSRPAVCSLRFTLADKLNVETLQKNRLHSSRS